MRFCHFLYDSQFYREKQRERQREQTQIGGERCPLCSYWLIRISCLSEITGNDVACECVRTCIHVHRFVCAHVSVRRIYGLHSYNRPAS